MKGEIGKYKTMAGEFNTLLSIIDSINRKKYEKTEDLNNIINLLDLTYLNISPDKCRIYIDFRSIQNIHQGRPYSRGKKKPWNI